MLVVFVICFLLIVVFLANGKRRMNQERFQDAGLNFAGAAVVTMVCIVIGQFV